MTTLIPNWVFDDTPIPDPHGRAARMLQFADILRHPKADGPDKRPLKSKWQRRIIERIYGPSDESGKRQVKTVFALLPRGARKTTLASVLALGHTIGPEQRPGGQAVSAAADRTQARLAFDEAADMIRETVTSGHSSGRSRSSSGQPSVAPQLKTSFSSRTISR